MRFNLVDDVTSDPGEWVLRGHDESGKQIRYRLRRIPGPIEQRLMIESAGKRKVSQDETREDFVKRDLARTRKRVVLALADTENVVIHSEVGLSLERFGGKEGDVVRTMDGQWDDASRDAFFRQFPTEQTFVGLWLKDQAELDKEQEVEESKT
jgi:hypothetical protein